MKNFLILNLFSSILEKKNQIQFLITISVYAQASTINYFSFTLMIGIIEALELLDMCCLIGCRINPL